MKEGFKITIKNKYTINEDVTTIHVERRNGDKFDTLIDTEDLQILNDLDTPLHVTWDSHTNGYYARVTKYKGLIDGKPKYISLLLHIEIMNPEHIKNIRIDHISGNTLDNRKSNLRRCNRTENNRNRKISKVNTSGYKGVDFCKSNKKYQARIAVDNVRIHLGYFKTPEEAYAAYCEASNKHHGDFGRVK